VPDTVPELFAELSAQIYDGLEFGRVTERAPLPSRMGDGTVPEQTPAAAGRPKEARGLELLRYRPLFSGPAVERVRELAFQRPGPVVELSPVDATQKGIAAGDLVTVRSGRASVQLTARTNRELMTGVVRIADEHATTLGARVTISRSRKTAAPRNREVLR
jgi:formylmethanofuran dehydrogenase subunit D